MPTYLYAVFRDEENLDNDNPIACIVEESYWNQNHHLDSMSFLDVIPNGFGELMEATYEFYDGDEDEMREVLDANGFIHSQEVEDYLASCEG